MWGKCKIVGIHIIFNLFLQSDELSMCKNLSVLYLYDNQLNRIPLLHQNQNITMLYLQNNDICKIENLTPLVRLSKL
jgi:protein phosphatase 1 regulatory subunit 42